LTSHDAGAAGFSSLLETMAQLDFFSLVFPFLLSYVIFLLALRAVPLFQDDEDNPRKGIPEIVSLISAFFTAQFIASNPWYQDFFVEYFGLITIGVVGILGLMILFGLVGLDMNIFTNAAMVILMISIVGAAFTMAGGFGPPVLGSEDIGGLDLGSLLIDTGLIWLLLIVGVIAWTAREPDNGQGNDTSTLELLFENLGDD